MATKYQYEKVVDALQLIDEIVSAGLLEPTINRRGQYVHIWFETELTSGEKGNLDIVVANHVPGEEVSGITMEDLSPEIASVISSISSELPYYKEARSDYVSTTTRTSLTSKVALTTESLEPGTYRLAWTYNWNADSTSSDFHSVLYWNGYPDQEHLQEPKDSSGSFGQTKTDQQHIASGFKVMDLSGIQTFQIAYRTTKNNRSASIWNARLELMRVK